MDGMASDDVSESGKIGVEFSLNVLMSGTRHVLLFLSGVKEKEIGRRFGKQGSLAKKCDLEIMESSDSGTPEALDDDSGMSFKKNPKIGSFGLSKRDS
ncbi:hypothetical protein ONS96_012320 [Cadophora gregata f. sp. sojae]|nr:hypothetical protein ONS96_012320 [Cadophora gregata f. sp. sojae]